MAYSFSLLDIEEKFRNVLPVESPRLKDRRNKDGSHNNDKAGLFSEVVFGTTKDYQCACGQYKGIMCQGIVCDNCKVMVQSSEARRSTFGKIDLGNDVFLVNPVAFKLLVNNCISNKDLRNKAYGVLSGKDWLNKKTGEVTKDYSDECYTGPHAFKDYIYPEILDHVHSTIKINENNDYLINKVIPMIDKCLFTHLVPIIPPDLRPIISGAGSTNFIDEINKYYMLMLNYVSYIKDSPIMPYDKIAVLQQQYFAISELLLKKLSSKTGIMRKYLLAKRVDYSGRSVIVPDYTLNIDQIDISFHIIKEVFKPSLLPKLAATLNISELEALNTYDSNEHEDVLFELSQEYCNYPCIINRQPTLHRASIMVMFIRKVIRDYVLVVPPIATEPFNADFDGDQMAMYFPIGGAAYNEALNLIPYKNIYLPSNGELAFEFKEDLVLGLYKISITEEGRRLIFSKIPKEAHPYIEQYKDSRFTGKVLSSILSILIDKLPNIVFTNMIDTLAHLSHTEAKITISLTDYAKATKEDLTNPVSLMIEAGARGKWQQARQINETRGFISDVEGRIIPSIINSSLLHGLSPNEYFVSAYGGIKGLIDSSRNTSISGYLTRRLIYLISNIELSESEWDCGSTNYLKLNLNEELIKMFMYRVVKLSDDPNDTNEYIITKDNYQDFADKNIYLRSPMTCLSKNGKICHKCYGYLFQKHKSRQIGYIAAQSIGERAAQLTLRTKHTSGATNISLPNWVNIEQGFIKTTVPVIIVSSNDGNVIINKHTNEEVDLPYSNIDIICDNYKSEVIHNDTDLDVINDHTTDTLTVDDNDEDFEILDDKNNDTVRYIVNDVGQIAKISLLSHDVVAAVSDFGKHLKGLPKYITNDMGLNDALMQLIDKLGLTNIHSIHYELLLSMFARRKSNTNDLYRNYPNEPYVWFKENDVLDNMLLQSMIFERFNQKLPKLLISDPNTLNWKSSIFMLLTSFDFGSKFIHSDPNIKLFGQLNCKEGDHKHHE